MAGERSQGRLMLGDYASLLHDSFYECILLPVLESLLYVDTNLISQRPPALPSPHSTEVDDRPVISPSYRGRHHRSVQRVIREEFRIDLNSTKAARSYQTCMSCDIPHQHYLNDSSSPGISVFGRLCGISPSCQKKSDSKSLVTRRF